jgi:selenium metabolism protein YedF
LLKGKGDDMKKEIDARGKACPEPVVLTKKALEAHDEVMVTVSDRAAEENVRRLAEGMGCSVSIVRTGDETSLHISRKSSPGVEGTQACTGFYAATGPVVVVIASDCMGRGDDELGRVLMKSFLHTLTEAAQKPDVMIFFNTGVKLTVHGSEMLADLEALSAAGVRIIVCGTCLGFFEMKDKLGAGMISNMYDITETMLGAGKLVQI